MKVEIHAELKPRLRTAIQCSNATRVMPEHAEAARAQNYHAIIASIDATNEASLRLHRSFGFEEVAHFREVGYKFGRWLDLKFLELILGTPVSPVEG